MKPDPMEEFDHIHYLACPHFTVGHVDQWGEHGYLLFEGRVYWYEEDRKDQCGSTRSPMSIDEFVRYADKNEISIPADFIEQLKDSNK
jgi:hypothetical protein